MRTLHALLLLVCLGLSLPSAAQWQWLDSNGKKVFSDRPPPGDIADKNILQRPTGAAALRPAAPPAPAAKASDALPKLSGKDKELEERRQQAEEQDAAKKKAEQQAQARVRADNCARARQGKATMDSGVRLARTDANGEREILDDAARAAETRRLQGIIGSDCG